MEASQSDLVSAVESATVTVTVFGGDSEADGRGKAHRKKRLRRCQRAAERPEVGFLESLFTIDWGAYLTIWLVLT